jgi:hypothetical protein
VSFMECCKVLYSVTLLLNQGILKGEVSLYC